MRGLHGQDLLRRPVRLRGIQLGRAVDLILDAAGTRVVGFDVLCGDGAHRFLPLSAAEAQLDQIEVRSALSLLDTAELAFYRERGTTLAALRLEEVDDGVLGAGGEGGARGPRAGGDSPGA
jgi:hypothetical protein